MSSGMVDRPLQHLHAAERAADRAGERSRSRGARAARGARVTRSRHGEQREAQTVRLAGGRVDRGRARSCPGSRRAGSRRPRSSRSVSSRLARADQVVPPADARGVAVVTGGVRVARQRVADEDRVRRGRRRGCRTSRRRPRPVPAVAPESSTSGSSSVKSDDPLRLDVADRAAGTGGGCHGRTSGGDERPRLRERLVEVGEDVVDVLDADRQADGVLRDAGRLRAPRRSAASAWSTALWIASDLRVADVGQVREQLERSR